MSNVHEELKRRLAKEREKALAKYGPEGLEPAGNFQLDVLDYAINEVVGLIRYADIIFYRREKYPPEFQHRTAVLSRQLKAMAEKMSLDLIALHLGLLDRGYLGLQEGDSGT